MSNYSSLSMGNHQQSGFSMPSTSAPLTASASATSFGQPAASPQLLPGPAMATSSSTAAPSNGTANQTNFVMSASDLTAMAQNLLASDTMNDPVLFAKIVDDIATRVSKDIGTRQDARDASQKQPLIDFLRKNFRGSLVPWKVINANKKDVLKALPEEGDRVVRKYSRKFTKAWLKHHEKAFEQQAAGSSAVPTTAAASSSSSAPITSAAPAPTSASSPSATSSQTAGHSSARATSTPATVPTSNVVMTGDELTRLGNNTVMRSDSSNPTILLHSVAMAARVIHDRVTRMGKASCRSRKSFSAFMMTQITVSVVPWKKATASDEMLKQYPLDPEDQQQVKDYAAKFAYQWVENHNKAWRAQDAVGQMTASAASTNNDTGEAEAKAVTISPPPTSAPAHVRAPMPAPPGANGIVPITGFAPAMPATSQPWSDPAPAPKLNPTLDVPQNKPKMDMVTNTTGSLSAAPTSHSAPAPAPAPAPMLAAATTWIPAPAATQTQVSPTVQMLLPTQTAFPSADTWELADVITSGDETDASEAEDTIMSENESDDDTIMTEDEADPPKPMGTAISTISNNIAGSLKRTLPPSDAAAAEKVAKKTCLVDVRELLAQADISAVHLKRKLTPNDAAATDRATKKTCFRDRRPFRMNAKVFRPTPLKRKRKYSGDANRILHATKKICMWDPLLSMVTACASRMTSHAASTPSVAVLAMTMPSIAVPTTTSAATAPSSTPAQVSSAPVPSSQSASGHAIVTVPSTPDTNIVLKLSAIRLGEPMRRGSKPITFKRSFRKWRIVKRQRLAQKLGSEEVRRKFSPTRHMWESQMKGQCLKPQKITDAQRLTIVQAISYAAEYYGNRAKVALNYEETSKALTRFSFEKSARMDVKLMLSPLGQIVEEMKKEKAEPVMGMIPKPRDIARTPFVAEPMPAEGLPDFDNSADNEPHEQVIEAGPSPSSSALHSPTSTDPPSIGPRTPTTTPPTSPNEDDEPEASRRVVKKKVTSPAIKNASTDQAMAESSSSSNGANIMSVSKLTVALPIVAAPPTQPSHLGRKILHPKIARRRKTHRSSDGDSSDPYADGEDGNDEEEGVTSLGKKFGEKKSGVWKLRRQREQEDNGEDERPEGTEKRFRHWAGLRPIMG